MKAKVCLQCKFVGVWSRQKETLRARNHRWISADWNAYIQFKLKQRGLWLTGLAFPYHEIRYCRNWGIVEMVRYSRASPSVSVWRGTGSRIAGTGGRAVLLSPHSLHGTIYKYIICDVYRMFCQNNYERFLTSSTIHTTITLSLL